MNHALGEYELNGWYIIASEMYNDWDLTPIIENDIDGKMTEQFRNTEEIRFKRLAEAKKWVKSQEAVELKNKYIKIN